MQVKRAGQVYESNCALTGNLVPKSGYMIHSSGHMKIQSFLCQHVLFLSFIFNGVTIPFPGDAGQKHRDNEHRRKARLLTEGL